MTKGRDKRGYRAPEVDPFREGRRPFWITVVGLTALVIIAWANGWIVPFWER